MFVFYSIRCSIVLCLIVIEYKFCKAWCCKEERDLVVYIRVLNTTKGTKKDKKYMHNCVKTVRLSKRDALRL